MSDILEHNGACSDQSVVILLVFLASQLIVKKNMVMLGAYSLKYYTDNIEIALRNHLNGSSSISRIN